ncbi:ABC transporter substrate-binding protein [Metabacillus halosaccharovorans]|uniref:ABC transporter substrate-binding protein n=1 Tax=Metabacillus halosaccharovorans TaxID=930124 RepID=UPI00203F112A|nr:ABC transporter substrate-binding protein [Metabacillus halosaccharovorans]MCM3443130.1 ABC transporter substrate-binding protein [Metabacillus halosaccharovorans]
MKKISFIITSFLLLVLAACSGGGEATSSSTEPASEGGATENDSILVTEAFHSLLYLPLYVGKKEGVFEDNNIDIKNIRSAGTGPTALASVLSGEAQFSVHGPEHVGFAQEKGGKAKAISAVANSAPVWVLANEDVEFHSPEDLKGKKIVVHQAPGTSNTLLKRLLLDAGLDYEKDVTVMEVQSGSELGPVLAGEADIAVAYQPQVDQGVSQGLKIVYDFTEEYPEYAFSTFNASEKLISENPDLVKRFVLSMDQSLKLIHENPDKAVAVAIEEFPELDKEVVTKAVNRMIDSNVYPPDVTITNEAFNTAIDMQKFVGNIKTDMKFEDIVDPSFNPNN